MEKGEGIWGISGAERSRAQLCLSGSVGALQRREWLDWCLGGAGTHGLVGKVEFRQRLDSVSLEIFSSLIDFVISVPGCLPGRG